MSLSSTRQNTKQQTQPLKSKGTEKKHLKLNMTSVSVCLDLDLILFVIVTERRVNKPLGWKLDDSVKFPLQGSRTFAHLDVLAVLSDRRVDLSLSPGLSLLQTQKFSGGR